MNLVSNAIKFTLKGRINVEVEGKAIASGIWEIQFAVRDMLGVVHDRTEIEHQIHYHRHDVFHVLVKA